jgi:hypothetical protein
VNQEIIRAREIIAELRLNNEKAHQLTHTLRNLLTIHQLRLEQIRRTARSATSGKTREEIEKRMDELAREFAETRPGNSLCGGFVKARLKVNPPVIMFLTPILLNAIAFLQLSQPPSS